ncbi:hypothetical protein N7G274_001065 [Stereocaulon virgatum]|uniref:Uncharacterized protein n=1 Tax=Stereocaulon virgatum TaxID=373712 RepID=A0ABR4AMS2_9LECA
MLSSHKTASLRSSTIRTVDRRTSAPTNHLHNHRSFSWGAKHKHNYPHSSKISKGFSTHDACKDMARRQLYRGTFWNQQYPLRHLPRYLRIQEWRLSSSWGRPDANSKNKPEEKYEDWFSRWQKRREEQYSGFARRLEYKERKYTDFMKKVEDDPYGVLFGRYWMKFPDSVQSQDTRDSGSAPQQASDAFGNDSSPSAERPINNNKSPGQTNIGDKQSRPKVAVLESRGQEYEIDPITMRKVLKETSPPESPATPTPMPEIESPTFNFDVPIKRFRAPSTEARAAQHSSRDLTRSNSTSASSPVDPPKPQNAEDWLAQEGFGRRQNAKAEDRPALKTEGVTSRPTAIKIESALDRHLKGKSTAEGVSERPSLQYQPKENTTEDIDLLRSSDVRASAGLRGKPAKESVSEKQARQRKLEQEYDQRPLDRESQLAQEVATDTPKRTSGDKSNTLVSSSWVNEVSDVEPASSVQHFADQQTHIESDAAHKPIAISKSSSRPQELADAKASQIKAQVVPLKVRLDLMRAEYDTLRKRWLEANRRLKAMKKANEMHEEEVKAQKQAMQAMETRGAHKRVTVGDKKPGSRPLQSLLPGEGDLARNVVEFAERDRWYKQKAPHAAEDNEAQLKKLAKDRNLIREVRSIYEDTYGIIDTKHRQPCQIKDSSKAQGTSGDERPSTSNTSVQSSSGPPSFNTQGKEPLDSSLTNKLQTQSNDSAQSSEPLAIIQRLFEELRQAQDLIHQHRTSLRSKETDNLRTVADTMPSASKAYTQIVLQIAKSSLQLSKTADAEVTISEAGHALSSSAIRVPSTETLKSAIPSVYRILVYDPATQKVIFSPKTTSLAPFSKEQPLTPIEALEGLKNPGKFLAHLMTLHNKGYNVVSSASNILVFKKEATRDELAAAKHVEARRYPNPVDGTIASTGNFASPTGFVNHDSPIPLEELEQHRAASAASSSKAATETLPKASPPSNKVRREEVVFSGRRRGGWQETKGRRYKRKKLPMRMLTFGLIVGIGIMTATTCYQIGVVCELMSH